ncbi:hypothetical protein ILUMI_07902 [Ignelater luminosus]|uniref:Reverse transcriptase domain-containing protein n=1 Tax=Ignelater luminosus TaxID=2038154 RepID=A0A8K0GHK0_IGNLU|nr:hypothetical protein ILUMI_07902 [Ignelater luminosus]
METKQSIRTTSGNNNADPFWDGYDSNKDKEYVSELNSAKTSDIISKFSGNSLEEEEILDPNPIERKYKISLQNTKNWNKKCGMMEEVHSPLFADDQIILAEDKEDITYIIKELEEEFGKWELKINFDKSQYRVIGNAADLQIDNISIKLTNEKRKRGRPRTQWNRQVQIAMEKTDLNEDVNDKKKWQMECRRWRYIVQDYG